MTQAFEEVSSAPASPNQATAEEETATLHRRLVASYAGLNEQALIRALTQNEFPGRSAVIASFGTESALLMDLVASVDRSIPVVFLDTGKHFEETLAYRDMLIARLGLTDVRNATPSTALVKRQDRDGMLWQRDPDACCHLRKVMPLRQALTPFGLIITGRKRAHGGHRTDIEPIEPFGDRIRLNPLADWDEARIDAEFTVRDLPRHPLQAKGYRSIGCAPCTDPVSTGVDARSGRWARLKKTECGIHFDKDGQSIPGDRAA